MFFIISGVIKMKTDNMDITIDDIINTVKSYNPQANFDLITKAYNLAYEAHADQKRISGEMYITHPLHVAMILTDLHIDDVTIAAALLHDVVEDTIYTIEQMKELFGEEVAMLIDGVTKLSKMKYKSKEDQQLETYRKMFLAMAKDIRVIMIKLADRLHNMRTLKYMREEKQKRIAKETLEVYAPLANRLGISNIKWELEDLCLRYLEPETYYDLVDKVNQKREERQGFINDAVAKIQQEFDKIHLKGEIKGRAKHFYSIYRKMKKSRDIMAIVLDEYGGVEGIVTLNDLIEQLVGDLGEDTAEEAAAEPHVEQMDENIWAIIGNVELYDIERALGVDIGMEDVDTFSGLVFGELDMIPNDGEQNIELDFKGLHIHITHIENHQISNALISKLILSEPDAGSIPNSV